jgi:hypothetical protein
VNEGVEYMEEAPEKKSFFYFNKRLNEAEGGEIWRIYYSPECIKSVIIILTYILLGGIAALLSILLIFRGGTPITLLDRRMVIGLPLTFLGAHLTAAGVYTISRLNKGESEDRN